MEPISLIGVIDSAIGLAFKCGSVAKRMNDIIKKYRNVELTVLAIVQSLYTIEIAWNQIAVWLKDYASVYSSEDDNFVERLEQSLRGGSLVLDALHREVLPYQVEDARWTFKQRIRIIWTEDSLQEHRSRLRDQASSMTLLLQAIQLRTSFGSNEIDDRPLDFENELFTARVYKRNYRNSRTCSLFLWNDGIRGLCRNYLKSTSKPGIYPQIKTAGDSSCSSESRGQTSIISTRIERDRSEKDLSLQSEPQIATKDSGFKDDPNVACKFDANATTDAEMSQDLLKSVFKKLAKAQIETGDDVEQKTLIRETQANADPVICDSPPSASIRRCESVVMHPLRSEEYLAIHSCFQETWPLHIAIRTDSVEVVKILIEAGVDVNRSNGSNRQPIHVASEYVDDPDMIRLLVQSGANIESEDYFGEKSLALACRTGHLGNVQTLLNLGASISHSNFRKAVINLRHDIVRELLIYGANPDSRCLKTGKTALLALCARRTVSKGEFPMESNTVRRLLFAGADFKARDFQGNGALHLLCKRLWLEGSVDRAVHEEALVHLVLDRGADIHGLNLERQSPLFIAAKHLNILLIRVLVDKGADRLRESKIVRLGLDIGKQS